MAKQLFLVVCERACGNPHVVMIATCKTLVRVARGWGGGGGTPAIAIAAIVPSAIAIAAIVRSRRFIQVLQ